MNNPYLINNNEFLLKHLSFIIIYITLVYFLSLQACSCPSCGSDENLVLIPDSIIAKADSFIISKTGEDFFKQYFQIDLQKSNFRDPYFHVYYNFRMLNPDFVDEVAHFYMDRNGNVIDTTGNTGIPDCLINPLDCSFYINESDARKIAEDEGLPAGIKDWLISFRWSSELHRYIWHIISTDREIGEGDFYRAAGKEVMINPSNGEVLKFRRWDIK